MARSIRLVEVPDTDEHEERAADTLGNTRGYARYHHGNQRDKSGVPYICHLDTVARNMVELTQDYDRELIQMCYLHDILEDVNYMTVPFLRFEGFSERVLTAVIAVTKNTGEANYKYITRVIEGGPDAIRVKLADVRHNYDPDRMAQIKTEADRVRLGKKYGPATYRLENALVNLGLLDESERTVTFEDALKAARAVVAYTSSSYTGSSTGTVWTKRVPASVLKGDTIRFVDDPDKTFVVMSTRTKLKGQKAFTLSDWPEGMEVVLVQGEFESIYGNTKGIKVESTSVTTNQSKNYKPAQPQWSLYMGLPEDWKDGDDVPQYLMGETVPEKESTPDA